MTLKRCVRHAINVPSVSFTNLTSDVGTDTSTFACLTFSMTTLAKSSWSGTVWIVEVARYTLPIATRRVGSPPTPIRNINVYVLLLILSGTSLFVLTLPLVGTTSCSRRVCCYEMLMDSSFWSNSHLNSSVTCALICLVNWGVS